MKLSEIKPNPSNPRKISATKLAKLKKSIAEFSRMMELRPMVTRDGIIIGGNQRYTALQQLGYTEIPDNWVVNADDLTPEEARRFIIADNLAFGEWDFELLKTDFQMPELEAWGFDEDDLLGLHEGKDDFDFGNLPNEDRAPFRQMTFTLHDTQAESVESALKAAKAIGPFIDSPNENGNGNALARICEIFLTEHGNS